jgi:predicted permease
MTWRSARKHKGFTLINISGLSLGLSVCLLIFLWVQDEKRYDLFHVNIDRIAQVCSELTYSSGQRLTYTGSYFPLARILEMESPEVEKAVRLSVESGIPVRSGDKVFYNDTLMLADSGFFEIFSFPLLRGTAASVFSDRSSIVLTESMAEKFFGEEEAVGRVLNVNHAVDLKVTGILRDIPGRSSLRFDGVIPFSWSFEGEREPEHWGGNPLETWVLLRPGSDPGRAARSITAAVERHHPRDSGSEEKFFLHPLARRRLYSPTGGGLNVTLAIFSMIAALVLIIACINTMNLSTARSTARSKEVGVRKALGAGRLDLVQQFLGESLFTVGITLLVSIGLIALILPAFNHLTGKRLSLALLSDPGVAAGVLGIALVTGFLAGSYPAFYLSRLLPSHIFRGGMGRGGSNAAFRKVLVIVQFSLSITLTICTVVLYRQLGYLQDKDLGFDRDRLAVLRIGDDLQRRYESLKTELMNSPDISAVTRAMQNPVNIGSTVSAVDWEGRRPDEKIDFSWDYVHYDYFETLGLEIVRGRAFSRRYPSDQESGYIINQKAAEVMGMDDPVGQRLSVFRREGRIVGVVKDFNFQPLYHEIKPFIFILNPGVGANVFLRLSTGAASGVRSHIRAVLAELSPGHPVDLYMFDDILRNLIYVSEQRAAAAAVYCTILAVLISCLGLFGLAAFLAERKTKEIGIRKILGASSLRLSFMLSRDFTKWVLLANVIAWPVAYAVSREMLQRFAFRVGIGADIFLLSGLAALAVALVTVSYQSLRASSADPAVSLRYE